MVFLDQNCVFDNVQRLFLALSKKHAVLRSKKEYRFTRSHDKMSMWSNMSDMAEKWLTLH